MPKVPQEVRFMGNLTAMTMHEMQNVMAIIREAAGLMGDILKVNARAEFKHRPNMERTVEHITSQVDRGKLLLDATSKLAHSPDEDMLESCDLTVYARTLANLAARMVRLKGGELRYEGATGALPVGVGALKILMLGYDCLKWAVGDQTSDFVIDMYIESGKDAHALVIVPQKGFQADASLLDTFRAILPEGRVDWDGRILRIFFPVKR